MTKYLFLEDEQFEIRERDFSIDRSDLETDLCSLGSRVMYYADIETRIKLAVETKEAALKKLEADLDDELRSIAEGGKKQTETQIKNNIIRNENYQKLQSEVIQLKSNYNLARWTLNALNSKKDCLINISYRDRLLSKLDGQ